MNCKPRFLKILIMVIGGIAVLSGVVMALCNWLLPSLLPGMHPIGYWQALGLFVLCRILFGGFRGGCRQHGRWHNMSEEERLKFKEGMRSMRGGWGRRNKTAAGETPGES